MVSNDLRFKRFGEKAILVEWPDKVDDDVLDEIIQFIRAFETAEKGEICNYASGYNSVLIDYKETIDFDSKCRRLVHLYKNQRSLNTHNSTTWKIPVCYDEEFGPDLSLFVEKGMTVKEVVDLHTANPFRVYMIGFLPGFLYLGGLPEELYLPRKSQPRQSVAKGSIAIGGKQTGIYPNKSPGGWQIIGRTPVTLFDMQKSPPISIRQGDYVQFQAIEKSEFQKLRL